MAGFLELKLDIPKTKGFVIYLIGDEMTENSWDNTAKFAELAKLAGLQVGENGVIESNVVFDVDDINELFNKIVKRYTLVVRPEMTAASTGRGQSDCGNCPPNAPPVPDVA